ncbi:hypothetical protein MXB_5505 [Myxobolus squamalis]|nr:hypothetical protein MXB_5505 [Myxobolus squamalis]
MVEVDEVVRELFDVDEGLLMVSNTEMELNTNSESELEESLKACALKCYQSLISKVKSLKSEIVDNFVSYRVFHFVINIELPEPVYSLPRVRQIPKPKPLSKWEAFSKEKGLMTKKKSRLVYDENSKEYLPRFAKNRINNIKDEWVIEEPKNLPPGADPFEMKETKKKERVAKNELSRLKNIKRRANTSGKKGDHTETAWSLSTIN